MSEQVKSIDPSEETRLNMETRLNVVLVIMQNLVPNPAAQELCTNILNGKILSDNHHSFGVY